ncbi:DUF2095 family protein [Candidatus Bathyarchaeota archaeon]|nr:DUF2095 family protein [Candidatus Bathyarchaeota archaeon]
MKGYKEYRRSMEKEFFRRLFPHLAEEIDKGASKMVISGLRKEGRWAGYDPDVVDFIRRCDTEAQAEEIIDYMERRMEITHERAEELRAQLRDKGLRSFGEKKEPGYYFKEG